MDAEHAALLQKAMDGISRANSQNRRSQKREGVLLQACADGNTDAARRVACTGVNNWSAALWRASYNGCLDIVRLAVERGVVKWPAVVSGASAGGRSAILQWAVARGASITQLDVQTAYEHGCLQTAKWLEVYNYVV